MQNQQQMQVPLGKRVAMKGDLCVPSLAVDAVVFKRVEDQLKLLMITRKNPPFQNCLALPGGYLDYKESPQNGCLRELREETNLIGQSCELLTVKGEPDRDPRDHVVSIVYLVEVNSCDEPKAGDDAKTASFYDMEHIVSNKDQIAFDHYDIIREAKERIENKPKN